MLQNPPICPMCGEPMTRRYRTIRAPKAPALDVWRCPESPTHAGAACFALLPPPPATVSAPADEPDALFGRYGVVTPIEQELTEADAAIEHCRRHAERHRAEAERRERSGQDASQARRLFRTLQRLQDEHEAHRDRLFAELLQSKATSS